MLDLAAVVDQVRRGMIPAHVYGDPEIFALERDRLFARSWVFLAHESGVPVTAAENPDPVIRLGNEFTEVVVERVQTRNGERLRISGFYPGRGGVLYVASKFAVRGCVIALAHELAPAVRINGVAPGGTLGTELAGARSLGLGDRVLGTTAGREQDLRRRTPLRVALTGEDHAGSYVFLASDRARGITGTVVHSDGGVGIG